VRLLTRVLLLKKNQFQFQFQSPIQRQKKPRAKKLNFVLDTEVKEDAANPPNLENETKPVSVQPTEVTIIKESETPVPTTKAKKVSSKKKVTLKLEE